MITIIVYQENTNQYKLNIDNGIKIIDHYLVKSQYLKQEIERLRHQYMKLGHSVHCINNL